MLFSEFKKGPHILQRSSSGYQGSNSRVFSLRNLTTLAAGGPPRNASLQCRHRSEASSFQIGVSGFRRTSLTAVKSMIE